MRKGVKEKISKYFNSIRNKKNSNDLHESNELNKPNIKGYTKHITRMQKSKKKPLKILLGGKTLKKKFRKKNKTKKNRLNNKN